MSILHSGRTARAARWIAILGMILGAGFAGSQAYADACSSAISRFNAAANSSNFQYGAKFRQLFGREPSAATGYQLPQECRQTLEILRWRRGVQQSLVRLERASHSVCRSINDVPGAAPASISANMSAGQLLAAIEQDLAVNTAICQQARTTVRTPTVGTPTVRTPTVRITEPTVRTPTVRTPTVRITEPTVRTPTVRTSVPKVRTPTVRTNAPTVDP